MKKLLLISIVLLFPSLGLMLGGFSSVWKTLGGGAFAQLSGISYQAVAIDENGKGIPGMDINGQALPSASISVRFSILSGSISGTLLYQETHTTNTDIYGLFSLVIGTGNVSSSGQYMTITAIPWQTADQYLKVELDIKNDGNYKLMSFQKFMAVPYSFYAAKSDTALYALNGSTDTSGASGSYWEITGNDTTAPGVNFLGTRDSLDLVIKTNNSEKMRVLADGKIGLGTNLPTNTLDVRGNGARFDGEYDQNTTKTGVFAGTQLSDTTAKILFSNGIPAKSWQIGSHDGQLRFYNPGSAAKMVMNTNGNVGIGTEIPNEAIMLDVKGVGTTLATYGFAVRNLNDTFSFAVRDDYFTAHAGTLGVSEAGGYGNRLLITSTSAGAVFLQNDSSSIIFKTYTGTQEKMRITDAGNVGIGTATPTATLEVAGQVKITGGAPGIGKVLTSDATGLATWNNINSGSVLSFSSGDLAPLFTTSVASSNTTPALSFNLSNANPYTLFGNNSGTSGAPGYFSPVLASSLFQNQGTATTVLHGNVAGNPSWGPIVNADIANGTIDVTSKLTGVLPIVNGGTNSLGIGSPGSVVYSDGTQYQFTMVGGSGKVLTSTVTGAPVWANSVASIAGTAPVLATTGDSIHYTIGVSTNSKSSLGVVDSGGANYNMVWKTDAQGNPGWRNDSSKAYTAGYGISFSADTINSVWTDSANNVYNNNSGNVGIGTAVPSEKLEVVGNTKISSLAGVGKRMVQADSVGVLVPLAADSANKVLLGTGVWGDVPSNTTWSLTGNSGIVDSVNFIGTLDTMPFNVRVNNLASGKIDPTLHNTFWGYKAGVTNTHHTIGYYNVGIGEEALTSNLSGYGNTAVGAQSLYSNTNGIGNVALGGQTLFSNTTGVGNVGVGGQALFLNTTGQGNVAAGAQAMYNNTTGTANVAVGPFSLFSNTVAYGNIAIGDSSMYANTTGTNNVAIGVHSLRNNNIGGGNVGAGSQVLYSNTSGAFNIGFGPQALYSNSIGNFNIAIGDSSLFNNTGDANLGIGSHSLFANTNGYSNVAQGHYALYLNTTGNSNVANGYYSLYSNTTGLLNTGVGYDALYLNKTANYNTAVGSYSQFSNVVGIKNTSLGDFSLFSNTADFNTAIGYYSLDANTTGVQNTAVGMNSLAANTTGNYNTATGIQALYNNTTANYNTATGAYALTTNTTGSQNTADGFKVLQANTTGIENAAFGMQALYANTTGSFNTATGAYALFSNDTGSYNTAVGDGTLYSNLGGISNTAVGASALRSNTTGGFNVAMGNNALRNNTNAFYNTAIGLQSMYSNTTGSENTAVGMNSLYSNTTGSDNTAIGRSALLNNTVGIGNVAVGRRAIYSNTAGSNSVAVGDSALFTSTTTSGNVAIGKKALYANTSGTNNTATGFNSLLVNTTGANNLANGNQTLVANTTGSFNTATGSQALYSNSIGSNNVASGYGSLYTNSIGNFNTATGFKSLYSNTFGSFNAAFGDSALYTNTIGVYNSALGASAMYLNTTGSFNAAFGGVALANNSTGQYNTAIGAGALYINTTGNYNTGVGAGALGYNFTGIENTATGNGALYLNNIGNYNVATGNDALKENLMGSYNTAVGNSALRRNISGTYNTAIGYQAFDTSTVYTNSTAIGYKASITASNMVQLGNTSITDVKTYGTMNANGYVTAFSNQSSNYTLTLTDDVVAVTGPTTINLPTAIGITGRRYTIKNVDATQTTIVDAFGSETIDGLLTKSLLTQYKYITVVSDGANWLIVANN